MHTSKSAMAGVFTASHALAAGYSYTEVRWLLRSRVWVTLRRGVYIHATELELASGDPARLHAVHVAAVLLALERPTVAAATSAARLFGMSFLNPPADEVVVLADATQVHGLRRDGYLLRQAPLRASDVRIQLDVPTTSPARTLLDLAADLPFVDAVVLADSALRMGRLHRSEVEEVLNRSEGRPGITQARTSLRFADGVCESPLESASRAVLHQAGLPAPQRQVTMRFGWREFRLDFLWPGLAGEADGLGKYEGDEQQSTLHKVRQEKDREQCLRDSGLDVVRWGWPEVRRPALLVARVSAALARVASQSGLAG